MRTNIYNQKQNHFSEKEKVFGQFFTKKRVVSKLIDLLLKYKRYNSRIKILEPSFGTGNFIEVLEKKGFRKIEGCEIDPKLTPEPSDFFDLPVEKKYDLIIGNPPFSKYNLGESFYYKEKYLKSSCSPQKYFPSNVYRKKKLKIENAFILKAIKHLKDENSSIAFVLPISFFIKGKNKDVKNEMTKVFSTFIIYQNNEIWFDYHIPCCFAIFSNIRQLKGKIVMLYENEKITKVTLDKEGLIKTELIPQAFLYKINNNQQGVELRKILSDKKVHYKKSYTENNVSAGNILERTTIPKGESPSDYKLSIARVGNASVGRTGLINPKKDILNDMFYVFDLVDEYKSNKKMKEEICKQINSNLNYFRNITFRVGSKSIKKEDIYNFKVSI